MRRRTPWLVAALLLAGAAAYLMATSDPPSPPSHRTVFFPRALRPAEVQRIQERQRRLVPAPAPERQAGAESKARDPLLTALPQAGKTALVVEANAIRNSPLGELLIRCFAQGEDPFRRFRDESGIDVLTDLDRVAFSEEGLLGKFQERPLGQTRRRKLAERVQRQGHHLFPVGRILESRGGLRAMGRPDDRARQLGR